MIHRAFWLDRIEAAWQKRNVIWFPGVRRAGKTTICKSIPDSEYFDCELPRVRRMMEDPEGFLTNLKGKRLVIDEVHRLDNPSELLKIAADHYQDNRIIATGSSTLSASKKFQDTLTGRKTKIRLTPMLSDESILFGNDSLEHRMLFGGLPPFFAEEKIPETDFIEWLDDYWSKDVQELFNITNKYAFQRFVELIIANSSTLFEATRYATTCEVSRGTITKYLYILEKTFVAHVIRPYAKHPEKEIISAPKVYGFDTGFVCHYRGWDTLRRDDMGPLWEHIVLNEIQGRVHNARIRYWRDKAKNELDFVVFRRKAGRPHAIECKLSANHFHPKCLRKFRSLYPDGENYVVASDVDRSYFRKYDDIKVHFVSLEDLINRLS